MKYKGFSTICQRLVRLPCGHVLTGGNTREGGACPHLVGGVVRPLHSRQCQREGARVILPWTSRRRRPTPSLHSGKESYRLQSTDSVHTRGTLTVSLGYGFSFLRVVKAKLDSEVSTYCYNYRSLARAVVVVLNVA